MKKKKENWVVSWSSKWADENLSLSEVKSDTIVEDVINKFRKRSEVGMLKYNTTLDRTDLSTLDWLTHLQEELMDAILYVERLKKEIGGKI
jgi:hypothetical protein